MTEVAATAAVVEPRVVGVQETPEAIATEAAAPAATVADAAAMVAPCVPKITAPDTFIAGLKDAGLPIGETVVSTADNDPAGLLGKDGGYDAAFGLADMSLPKADGLAGGGVVEFFKNPESAKARAEKAVADATDAVRAFFGPILVRLAGNLDRKQVDACSAAVSSWRDGGSGDQVGSTSRRAARRSR